MKKDLTAKEIFDFVNEYEWEWRELNTGLTVLVWPYWFQLDTFLDIIPYSLRVDEGLDINIRDGYAAIDMDSIVGEYGYSLTDVFGEPKI